MPVGDKGPAILFEPTIVSDVVIATAFGFAVAFAIYWWFSKSRGALRFIDLVSFAIGFLAICAGLFAVYNYRGDSEKIIIVGRSSSTSQKPASTRRST